MLFGLVPPWPVTDAKRRNSAAWIWEQLTGGDYRDAPALDIPGKASVASRRMLYARFAGDVPAPVAEALLKHGGTLLASAGTA